MPADPAAARAVFHEVVAVDDPAARTALVAERCGGDAVLLARVNALLAANDRALADEGTVSFAGGNDADATADRPGRDEVAGAVIAGKYTLVEPIGEGGMGSVWRSKQTEPVKRFVAVKLIKAGMDSKQVLTRFEAERQALALMDHPNIAKVLDGGLHDHRPYFVMELVKGVPITDYCDHHKLTPQARLELFVQACQAIQHAHQKGIIHRDIKPSNVLVALYDDRPVVKVIDFGVAKATGGTLTEATIDTGFGGVVGTPQYMSPEQATFNNLDIDTRTDVYALGVLLYELLTGSPPFSRKELEKKGLLEILRVVREEEPPRPSTKLSTADALPSLSANRGTEPKKLTGLLRNELDWVVMKALEKDRTRRYETANGFAADVQRYLSGEAVIAHPPSTAYRIKKFVRRYRGQVIAASLVLLALLTGVVGTALGLLEARRQTAIARDEAEAKEQARAEETNQRAIAQEKERQANAAAEKERTARLEEERQRKYAQAIADFVVDDFLALTSVEGQDRFGGEGEGLDRNATLLDLLYRAAEKLKGRKDLAPQIEAKLCWIVGVNYRGVGEAAKGIPFLERSVELWRKALGVDHQVTLNAINSLGMSYLRSGKLDQAVLLHEETLKLRKDTLGPDHIDTLVSMNNLARTYEVAGKWDKALPLQEEAYRRQKETLGPDHRDTLVGMYNLAMAYRSAGKWDEALSLSVKVYHLSKDKHGSDRYHTLIYMNGLAVVYMDTGKHDLALPLLVQSLTQWKAKFGPDHLRTFGAMSDLARCYLETGKPDKALPLFEEALELAKVKLGANHPNTIIGMGNVASCYWSLRRLDRSVPLFEEQLPLAEKVLGRSHPKTLTSVANLGVNYKDAGRVAEAIPLLEEAYRASKEHASLRSVGPQLLDAYAKAGKPAEAAKLFNELLADARMALPKNSPELTQTIVILGNHVRVLEAQGDPVAAAEVYRQLLEARKLKAAADKMTIDTENHLGLMLLLAGQYAEAEKHLLNSDRDITQAKDVPQFWRHAYAFRLMCLYAEWGKPGEVTKWQQEASKRSGVTDNWLAPAGLQMLKSSRYNAAELLLRETLAIREKTQPDVWFTFNIQSMLGRALLGQKNYADAEPLLLKGYEGMKQREKSIPPSARVFIPESLDRLIELYTAMNKPDEAKKWQVERAKYREVLPPPRADK